MILTIEKATELLKEGKLVAFPTETVYGLGARVFDLEALKRIYIAKGRPSDNPLIVHIHDLRDLHRVAIDIPRLFFILYAHFFPGPLTVVLKKHPDVPPIVSGGMDTIAVRMPAHPIARLLIKAVGEPLAAPSANLSGKPSSTEASHVLEDFGDKIGGVIDGGSCLHGLESTVISLLTDPPVILRPGKITLEEIEKVLGQPVRMKNEHDATVSPGMKYRHYAPKAKIHLFTKEKDLLGALTPGSFVLNSKGSQHTKLSPENFYKILRDADRSGIRDIFILCDEALLANAALMNRILHAASQSCT